MDFASRVGNTAGRTPTPAAQRCPQCRAEALTLQRRHVSPPRLGAALITEYYGCDFCDAQFQYSPATGSWRPVYQ